MAVREDSLKSLAHLLGWSGCMANLEDDLVEMHRDHNHWRRQAEEAETVSVISKQQEAAACSLCISPLPTLRMPLGRAPLPDY